MLHDTQRHQALSSLLAQSRAPDSPAVAKPRLFREETYDLEGTLFQPLEGFHFGYCGPTRILEDIHSSFYCDMPVVMLTLVLEGEYHVVSAAGGPGRITLGKGMFAVCDWEGLCCAEFVPRQEAYCQLGIGIEKGTLAAHFGEEAEREVWSMLRSGGRGKQDALPVFYGTASPDVLALARRLLRNRVSTAWEIMELRATALEFFTKLACIAKRGEPGHEIYLDAQDITLLQELKKRIEDGDILGETTTTLCASVGMSESKGFIRLKSTFDKKSGHGFQSRVRPKTFEEEVPCPRVSFTMPWAYRATSMYARSLQEETSASRSDRSGVCCAAQPASPGRSCAGGNAYASYVVFLLGENPSG